jgi:tRNA-splicing ligase RtcB
MAQALNLAKLPFAFHHIALMPDAHSGYGMPIGGVLATEGVVLPFCVGMDIGCGVRAVRTSLSETSPAGLQRVVDLIRERVPTGFAHHADKQGWVGFDEAPAIKAVLDELEPARYQLGTLGGGNHFMSLLRGGGGNVRLMVHSGSRNFGLKLANHYHALANQLCARWRSALPDPDLAFLPLDTAEGEEYMVAMRYAADFARESRGRIMLAMQRAVEEVFPGTSFEAGIDVMHNYARIERYFGHNVVVHRKGATSARLGELGIIPGSKGTNSYIVAGLGNPESFMSCSHGAGRKMGRKQAKLQLNLQDEIERLNSLGIIHNLRSAEGLDEAVGAYKDIEQVMADQADLVRVVEPLTPLASVMA